MHIVTAWCSGVAEWLTIPLLLDGAMDLARNGDDASQLVHGSCCTSSPL